MLIGFPSSSTAALGPVLGNMDRPFAVGWFRYPGFDPYLVLEMLATLLPLGGCRDEKTEAKLRKGFLFNYN